jgi:WD40 repeat protein
VEGSCSQKGKFTVENENIMKGDEEQVNQRNDSAGLTISRRQFSTGLSGALLAGTILELSKYDTLNTLAAETAALPARPGSQKLTPHAFSQPQYILPGTTGSIWSPDGCHIATFQENVVTLYNADTGAYKLAYRQHADEILTVQWSSDSKYLASGGFDQVVLVWNAARGQTITEYHGHTNIVRDIAWSPNQYYIASTGYDKTVQVWEALTGTPVVTYSGHAVEIQSLRWSPDSKRIASTDLQNKTIIWRVM